jgi:hypothetical protein
VASKSLQLTVRPLPQEEKPPDFSGLVGEFEMSSTLEPGELKTGESATLTVTIKGQGNVNRIPDLKISQPDHIKVYADKPILDSEQDSTGLKGTKTMKWALVPEIEGRLEIPSVSISYFDTKSQRYKTLQSPNYFLAVLPGKQEPTAIFDPNPAPLNPAGAIKQTVEELGRDIFPVHTAMLNLKTVNRRQFEGRLFGAMLALPFALYLVTLCTIKLHRHSKKVQPNNMARKAARTFRKQYRQPGLTSSKLLQLIREYLNTRCGLAYGSLTPQEAAKLLISRGVRADTADELQSIMQQLEVAEYTGQGDATARVEQDLAPLIKQIEKQV